MRNRQSLKAFYLIVLSNCWCCVPFFFALLKDVVIITWFVIPLGMKVLWVELVLLTFSISSSFILHCNTYSPVEYIVRIAEETWLDKSFISFWNETFFKSTTKRFINGSSRVRSLERNSWRSPKNVFVGGWCEEYRSYDTVMLITVSVLFYP